MNHAATPVVLILGLACGRPSTSSIVVDHVTVIDVDGGSAQADQTVVVTDGRIAAVGPAASTRGPNGAVKLDGQGKFLIPGLWDMHVHLWQTGEATLPLLVAHGITGARDMGGDFQVLAGWRHRIETDSLLGPRLVLPGPRLDGPTSTAAVDRLVITTAAAGTAAVDSLAALGVDFLKVYQGLPRDAFFSITRQARSKGLELAGHVPQSVTPAEASDSGQKSIEHLGFIPPNCFAMFDPGAIAARAPVAPACLGEGLDTLFARFARNGTWLDPTLISFRGFVLAADSLAPADPRMRYVSPELEARWRDQLAGFPKWPVATWQAVFDHAKKLAGIVRQSGAPVLAGTDLGNPHVYPGSSLHEELALLIQSGYSPAEALRSATSGPARFLGLADSIGTITQGKAADLVLLSGNPLLNIANTRRIAAVIVRGRLLTRATLDSVLDHRVVGAGGSPP